MNRHKPAVTEGGFVTMDVIVALSLSALAISVGLASLEVTRRSAAKIAADAARSDRFEDVRETLARVIATYEAATKPDSVSFQGTPDGFSFLSAPLAGRETPGSIVTHVALRTNGGVAIWRTPLDVAGAQRDLPPPVGMPDWESGPVTADADDRFVVAGFRYLLRNGTVADEFVIRSDGATPGPVVAARSRPELFAVILRMAEAPRAPLAPVLILPPGSRAIPPAAEAATPPAEPARAATRALP